MMYDDELADRRDRLPREDAAEARRLRREARIAFAEAGQRRQRAEPLVTAQPTLETIEHAGVILEPAGLLLRRRDIERMAAEVAADYCGADASRGIR